MSNLVKHAQSELREVGYSVDSPDPLDREIYLATIDIVERFAQVGHSGYSAAAHRSIINRLLSWQPLGTLTDDPEEWEKVSLDDHLPHAYQSRRMPSAFTEDLKTYYRVDELRRGWRAKLFGRVAKRYPLMKKES